MLDVTADRLSAGGGSVKLVHFHSAASSGGGQRNSPQQEAGIVELVQEVAEGVASSKLFRAAAFDCRQAAAVCQDAGASASPLQARPLRLRTAKHWRVSTCCAVQRSRLTSLFVLQLVAHMYVPQAPSLRPVD